MSAPELPDFSLSFRPASPRQEGVEHPESQQPLAADPGVAPATPIRPAGAPRQEAISLSTRSAVHAWHAWTHARLCASLAPAFAPRRGQDGWWLGVHPELDLGSDGRLRPDLAAWRRSHLPGLPDGAFRSRPDWVAEVLEPGDTHRDRITRRRIYGEHEVAFLWLVDPRDRLLEAFAWDDGRWSLLGAWTDGDHLGVLPFDSVVLDVGSLFPPR